MLKDFTREKYDIIIQAGQSNAEGNGMGEVENPWKPNEDVWYMNGALEGTEFIISPAVETVRKNEVVSNFNLRFAERYLEAGLLKKGRKLLILCTAVGGTGFIDGQWKMKDIYYLRMMEMIRTSLALNKENRLVALLWHQGESDSLFKASYDVHYAHLTALLNSVRNEFNVPELPFVAGDFVYDWKGKNIEVCIPVVDAIRGVCRDCGHGFFVESDGLTSNMQQLGRLTPRLDNMIEDDIHFSRKALYELGDRYFEGFLVAKK